MYSFCSHAQKQIEHYENGNIKSEQTTKDGHSVGKAIFYYESGKRKTEARYDNNGVLIGYTQWHEDGTQIIDRDLIAEQLKKGKTDLSKITWTKSGGISVSFIDSGAGNLPSIGNTINLNYIGYFKNGLQFDNSYDSYSPLQFEVGNNTMLASFADGIIKFKKGQKGYIKIPPELAFGDKPSGNIPANSTLIYYIEVIDIRK